MEVDRYNIVETDEAGVEAATYVCSDAGQRIDVIVSLTGFCAGLSSFSRKHVVGEECPLTWFSFNHIEAREKNKSIGPFTCNLSARRLSPQCDERLYVVRSYFIAFLNLQSPWASKGLTMDLPQVSNLRNTSHSMIYLS